ncbi:MAG: SCO family protein, partial [Anaerolineae bacterium]|nr:SCO family protein [Anaerolineae bacterium]
GKVSLLFFGYTTCPDVCPTTLAEARTILNDLGDDANDVEFLFVTVDPERDTPEKLAAYTDAFHPGIIGLTGTPDQLASIYGEFGVRAERVEAPESALGYLMNHTSRMYLVDQDGNLRLSYGYGTPVEDIVNDVKHLVK